MSADAIIQKKANNLELTEQEIDYIVQMIHEKKLTDETIGDFLKAVKQHGFNDVETLSFFDSSYKRSTKIKIHKSADLTVDKHSTGGIGDKTTMVLMPLLLYFGVRIYKFSGGRLGHTGGTLDKLAAFFDINLNYSPVEIFNLSKKQNSMICYTLSDICEIEKKLYTLRNKTNTTDSVDLIVNSILIKKLLLHNDVLVLDIKVGLGSFFQNTEEIKRFTYLAKLICKKYQRKLIIIYSNMEQPLGYTVGNKIEVLESIEVLSGQGPDDVVELATELCAQSLVAAGKFSQLEEARTATKKVIETGAALPFFQKIIENQGGNWTNLVKKKEIKTRHEVTIFSSSDGYFLFPNAAKIGHFFNNISIQPKETIDLEAGIHFYKKNNDEVATNDALFTFYTSKTNLDQLKKQASELFIITDKPTPQKPLTFKEIN